MSNYMSQSYMLWGVFIICVIRQMNLDHSAAAIPCTVHAPMRAQREGNLKASHAYTSIIHALRNICQINLCLTEYLAYISIRKTGCTYIHTHPSRKRADRRIIGTGLSISMPEASARADSWSSLIACSLLRIALLMAGIDRAEQRWRCCR